MDVFGGFELDLIGFTGIELGFGVVFDTDNWLDSGVYVTVGVGVGANVGWGWGGGFACRDIEGTSYNADVNAGAVSGIVSFDDKGFNGVAGSWGPGLGGSVSVTETVTLSPGSIANAFARWSMSSNPGFHSDDEGRRAATRSLSSSALRRVAPGFVVPRMARHPHAMVPGGGICVPPLDPTSVEWHALPRMRGSNRSARFSSSSQSYRRLEVLDFRSV